MSSIPIQQQEVYEQSNCIISIIHIFQYYMIEKSTLPLFHFLFTELIEETYKNYKEEDYLTELKKIGIDIGYRLYTHISIKKQINERPATLSALMKNIQIKVFKFLFNYEASNYYPAEVQAQNQNESRELYQVIEDNISIYLTWMPQHLHYVSILIAGIIEAICKCSGFICEVSSSSHQITTHSENVLTKYLMKYSENEAKKWNQKE